MPAAAAASARLLLLAVAVAGWAACSADGRVLQQTRAGLDLILGVAPEGRWDYGGRHITIARVTAPSSDVAAGVIKACSSKLADASGRVGWTMKGPPSNCLGHMNAGTTSCKDANPWDLSSDGYGPTPTIAIASSMLDSYAACLAGLKTGSTGVTIAVKGPVYSDNHTVWHSALYNTANAQAELKAFVSGNAKWVPFLNGRYINAANGCPDVLSPKGAPGPMGGRCWHWTPVP